MSGKQVKEVKKMCRAFCIKYGVKWSRSFERAYVKEFFGTRRLQIVSIHKRRKLGILTERRAKLRGTEEHSVLAPPEFKPQPAEEGDTD